MSTPAAESEGRAESGFVLVAVLWILAALATLASIYAVYAVNTANASHVADDRVQAEASIRAGVEMAVFRQLALPEQAMPTHGAFDLRVGRTSVTVDLRSEPRESTSTPLRRTYWPGCSPPSASTCRTPGRSQIGSSAGAQRPTPTSKEAKLYAEQGVRFPPRQAPFDNALKLNLLPGLPEPVVERVLPFVTVFNGRPAIDVASADPTVLSALPGMTPQILGAFLKARANDPGDGRALLELLGPARSRASADRSKTVRAAVEVAFDNGRRIHAEVVFRLKDGGDEPYDLLYWRDDFDGPMQSG
jgi:general secretion pathway protein K